MLAYAAPEQGLVDSGNTPENNRQHVPVITLLAPDDSRLRNKLRLGLLEQLTNEKSPYYKPAQIRLLDTGHTGIADKQSDLLIIIGSENIALAEKIFPGTPYLLLATRPLRTSVNEIANNSSILYITQPLCRQLRFIHLLNSDWTSFGYLSSREDYPDANQVSQCAAANDLKAYREYIANAEMLSTGVKTVLHKSDVLLALPDNLIYNRKTVKNILLSSYRLRKPVIAFSKSLLTAGAIASIYSNTQQIARSASALVADFFSANRHFTTSVNYPREYEISFNPRVIDALRLDIPSVDKIRSELEKAEKHEHTAITGAER